MGNGRNLYLVPRWSVHVCNLPAPLALSLIKDGTQPNHKQHRSKNGNHVPVLFTPSSCVEYRLPYLLTLNIETYLC